MVRPDNPQERLDYMIAIDAVPGGGPWGPIPLAQVGVTSIEVVRFAAGGSSLSDHDAVAAELTITAAP